jgi:hypothetical protein
MYSNGFPWYQIPGGGSVMVGKVKPILKPATITLDSANSDSTVNIGEFYIWKENFEKCKYFNKQKTQNLLLTVAYGKIYTVFDPYVSSFQL